MALKTKAPGILLLASFFFAAWGHPTSLWWAGSCSAICGFALYFRLMLGLQTVRLKFLLGMAYFTGVQLVQMFWLTSHPYNYIYGVYIGFALLWGCQWGIFSLLITESRIKSLPQILALAALWTLFEWSRLFFLSGYSWNPVGLALTGNIYTLQLASLWGAFGLSFWVIFVNLLALRAWISLPNLRWAYISIACALFPYAFGGLHLQFHASQQAQQRQAQQEGQIRALLVQTAFPAEEALTFSTKESYIFYVLEEWKKILHILEKHKGKKIDLIALPEYVVPFATYSFVYPYEEVKGAFAAFFGEEGAKQLPAAEAPFAKFYRTPRGEISFVNNAFWVQGIANIFDAEVVAGLEDVDLQADGKRLYYSTAQHFKPSASTENFAPTRYAKRVLLPMAEYIPSTFFQELAAAYGIGNSFTPGQKATVMQCGSTPFGVSICYEETFGDLIREFRNEGAHFLLNLTSDVWYPNSRLPQQHRDHARLRTVENGVSLLRACNTGVTCAFDSLGNNIAMLGDGSSQSEWLADALYVEAPTYNYQTLYSITGDKLIIFLCLVSALALFYQKRLE